MKINSITPNNYNISNINNINTNSGQGTKNASNPSFGSKVPQPVVKGLSSFYEKAASTKPIQKFVKALSNSDRTFTHIMVAESVLLSGFYMINTLANKKIDKEQKPQMLINDTLTLGVSTAGAYLLDDKVSKVVNTFSENFIKKHHDFYGNDIAKIEGFKSGMGKLKTIVIFGLIYRFLGPVVITPIANKLSSKLFSKKQEHEQTQDKK